MVTVPTDGGRRRDHRHGGGERGHRERAGGGGDQLVGFDHAPVADPAAGRDEDADRAAVTVHRHQRGVPG